MKALIMPLREQRFISLQQNGHKVMLHDLHKENFDPLLPCEEMPKDAPLPKAVKEHCRELIEAEGIIIVHPNWWGQPPAILKGWWTE